MKPEIVIFDLDGTLLNTLEDLTDSTNFALKQFNYPQKSVEQVRTYVGNGVVKLIERAIPNEKNNPNFGECLDIFRENYSQNMYNKTKPYDGIIELLTLLKSQKYLTAVVSNKFDDAVKELCKNYFSDLIDYCAGENEAAGIRKKPAPDAVLKILNYFDLNSNQAVYIGDSEVDIQTARNSNMKCISVTWGFKDEIFLKNNGAEIIARKPAQIIDILENL